MLRWIGAQIAIGLLLAPWYLQPRLLFGSGYGGTAGQFDPPAVADALHPDADVRRISCPLILSRACAAAARIALLVGLFVWWRRNRRQALLFGLIGTIPLLLLGVVSTKLNVFEPRYVLAAAPAYTLILCVLVLRAAMASSGDIAVAVLWC